MSKPKVKIDLDIFDKSVEVIGFLGLLLLIGLPIFHYSDLPSQIPIHYGVGGNPDGFGDKYMIWTLPLLGVIMYIGLFFLNRYPHLLNYPKEITEENAYFTYRMATKMIRLLNVSIVLVFGYMTYIIIHTALGSYNGLSSYFTSIFFVLIFGIIGYYIYKMIKK